MPASTESSRLPPPVDPVGRLPGARRRYERRWGFLPYSGRADLPRTGRTALYRVEWGRRGRELCVMLTRWEHRRGRWRRDAVVEHAWLSAEDAEGIGATRHRLGARGEALEEAEDAARLERLGDATLALAPPVVAAAPPPDRPAERELPVPVDPVRELERRSAWRLLDAAVPLSFVLILVTAHVVDDPGGNLLLIPELLFIASFGCIDLRHRLLRRRADRAAGRFLPAERRRGLPPSGRRTLCRVEHGVAPDGAVCLMLVRWRYRRKRWRRDDLLDHVWLAPGDAAGLADARERLEARAAAIERADAGRAPDPLFHQERRPRPRKRSRDEHAATERRLADLSRELHALDDLVEDLAEDPR